MGTGIHVNVERISSDLIPPLNPQSNEICTSLACDYPSEKKRSVMANLVSS